MGKAKVRSLQVRPFQSADLAFDTPGIVFGQDLSRTSLGKEVSAFDFNSKIYAPMMLRQAAADGRLVWDAAKISQELSSSLFSLQNHLVAAELQQSIAQRQVAFLQRFEHKTGIVSAFDEVYSGAGNKLDRLTTLRGFATKHTVDLKAAYEKNKSTGVSTSVATTSDARTKLAPIAMKTDGHTIAVRNSPANSDHVVPDTRNVPQKWDGSKWDDIKIAGLDFDSQLTTGTSITANLEYRYPFLENLINDQRTQLDLQDEIFQQKTLSFAVKRMSQIIDKELEIIDLEILKSQLLFAQTFLVSPISGVITAIYKDLGESVQVGEPVVRVENYEKILLVGIIQHRGALTLNRTVQVLATDVFESGSPLQFGGSLVSIRGHDSDDDEWDVIIECNNPGKQIPINFHFDREMTSLTIS